MLQSRTLHFFNPTKCMSFRFLMQQFILVPDRFVRTEFTEYHTPRGSDISKAEISANQPYYLIRVSPG